MINCLFCKNKHANFLFKKNIYSYYFCNRCKTLFIYPQLNKQRLLKYYYSEFNLRLDETDEIRIKTQSTKIINNLLKLNPSGKKLLDIGSGYGYLLSEANKKELRSIGIEPSKNLSKFSSIKHLIKVFSLDFDRFYKKNKNMRFDFVVLSHVIEHLKDPLITIKKISRLLNKNGVLYIETPNLNSWLFKAEKENYTFLTPPDHLWIFSLNSFRFILNNISCFKLIKFSTYSYPEHGMGIIKTKLKIKSEKLKVNSINNPLLKKIKFLVFDRIIANIFIKLIDFLVYGSILELYIRKKSSNCRL